MVSMADLHNWPPKYLESLGLNPEIPITTLEVGRHKGTILAICEETNHDLTPELESMVSNIVTLSEKNPQAARDYVEGILKGYQKWPR